MYQCMWQVSGRDLEVVMRDLRYLGYTEDLRQENRLKAVLSIHSDCPGFDLTAQPVDPVLRDAALKLPVIRWGERVVVPPALASDAFFDPGTEEEEEGKG
ncbi:unnamed protein product, partial [Discosporangium mesarthrocarpum]